MHSGDLRGLTCTLCGPLAHHHLTHTPATPDTYNSPTCTTAPPVQGIFVNFRDLLYYNGNKLPFAAAQIGNSYRNEISPRAGLLRVREFTQVRPRSSVCLHRRRAPPGAVAGVCGRSGQAFFPLCTPLPTPTNHSHSCLHDAFLNRPRSSTLSTPRTRATPSLATSRTSSPSSTRASCRCAAPPITTPRTAIHVPARISNARNLTHVVHMGTLRSHLATFASCSRRQMGEEKKPKPMALGEAVSRGIIANETLAYFIGRTWLLFGRLGVDLNRMRFRQHLQHEVRGRGCYAPVCLGGEAHVISANTATHAWTRSSFRQPTDPLSSCNTKYAPSLQMAHYAEDCWDAEVETSYGWVECAGLADRSAYDLRAHTAMSKTELTAYEKFPEPREVEVTTVTPNKKELGLAFKRDAKAVADALEALGEEDAMCLKSDLDAGKSGKLVVDGNSLEVRAVWGSAQGRRALGFTLHCCLCSACMHWHLLPPSC